MKKLLVISNTSFSIERFRSHYLNQLSSDFKILVVSPQNKPKNLLRPSYKSLKTTYLLFEIFKIFKIIRSFKPEKILVYSFKYQLIISLINIFFKIELICLIAGKGSLFLNSGYIINLTRSFIVHSIFTLSDKIIFINPSDKTFFCNKYNIIRKSYLINTEGLKIIKLRKKKISKKNFIFFGRLIREKGIYEYVEVAEVIKKKYPYLNFYICGPIKKNEVGQSIMFTKNIKNYLHNNKKFVKYLGFQKDFKKVFTKMDCLISPSYSEGAGTSVMEAMMSGLYIIGYKNNGHNLILNKTNNYVCKKNNIKEIEKGIIFFLNSKKSFIKRNLIVSYKKIKDNYSSQQIYREIRAIIFKSI